MLFGTDDVADATRQAGNIQADAYREGIEEQRRQFDITQETLRPAIEAGDEAREQQMIMLGLRGPEAQQELMSSLQESPAQKFIRKRAERAIVQNAAATGGLGGGNVKKELAEYGAGLAMQDIDNQFTRYGQIVAPGTTAATNQSQFGHQTANNIADLTGRVGNATASGILGAEQVMAQGAQNVFGAATTLGAAYMMAPAAAGTAAGGANAARSVIPLA